MTDSLPSASVLRRVGGRALAAGSLFVVAGATAWSVVSKQLRDEHITVPDNAPVLAGRQVQGPATAYVQALVIQRNAENTAGGRTFSDVAAALEKVDPASDEAQELRRHRMGLSTAASLRTSLMTSVLAFGVSAFIAGIGSFFVVLGTQLRRAPRR